MAFAVNTNQAESSNEATLSASDGSVVFNIQQYKCKGDVIVNRAALGDAKKPAGASAVRRTADERSNTATMTVENDSLAVNIQRNHCVGKVVLDEANDGAVGGNGPPGSTGDSNSQQNQANDGVQYDMNDGRNQVAANARSRSTAINIQQVESEGNVFIYSGNDRKKDAPPNGQDGGRGGPQPLPPPNSASTSQSQPGPSNADGGSSGGSLAIAQLSPTQTVVLPIVKQISDIFNTAVLANLSQTSSVKNPAKEKSDDRASSSIAGSQPRGSEIPDGDSSVSSDPGTSFHGLDGRETRQEPDNP